MDKSSAAWLIIRTSGVICLACFLYFLVSLICFLPAMYAGPSYQPGMETRLIDLWSNLRSTAMFLSIHTIVNGALSLYLLKFGKWIHKLLLNE